MSEYKDPLHMPPEKLTVYHKGKPVYMMNKRLLDRQNCWTNLDAIKEAHVRKLDLYDKIKKTRKREKLKELASKITEIEFELQGLWKFPLDKNFHRFWETPKCSCAKMDNSDNWGSGYYYITTSCLLHGD